MQIYGVTKADADDYLRAKDDLNRIVRANGDLNRLESIRRLEAINESRT